MDCGPIDPVTLFTSLKHAEVIKNIEHKLTLKKRQRTLRNEHMSSLVAQLLFKNSLIVLKTVSLLPASACTLFRTFEVQHNRVGSNATLPKNPFLEATSSPKTPTALVNSYHGYGAKHSTLFIDANVTVSSNPAYNI